MCNQCTYSICVRYANHRWISILNFHQIFKVGVQNPQSPPPQLHVCNQEEKRRAFRFSHASVWTQRETENPEIAASVCESLQGDYSSFFFFLFSNLATAGTDLGRLCQHQCAILLCNRCWAGAHKSCINIKCLFFGQTPCRGLFVTMSFLFFVYLMCNI